MLTQDDVLYMIVTDRFANGDRRNDGPDCHPTRPDRRHGGDLLGIVQRMPYLVDLGVTTLWITPVYPNPKSAYHGYHPLDFERVDPHLCSPELGPPGSRRNVRRFVEIAHEHGLKVMLDLVVNHTAPEHPWLNDRPGWYNPDQPTPEKWWVWGLPDLNHDHVDVRDYFIRNVLRWITETGVDAIRLDAARHVESEFWHLFKLYVKGLAPDCTVVGEVWDGDPHVVAPYQTTFGFDSMFDFPLQGVVSEIFGDGGSLTRIAGPELYPGEPPGVLNQDWCYRNAMQLITFLDNHDLPRFLQVAGALTDLPGAVRRLKLALAFLFTARGIPQLYYGTELALGDGGQTDNRTDMQWEREAAAGVPEHVPEVWSWVKRLIGLRRESPALRYGATVTLYVTRTFYAFARVFPGDPCVVAINNDDAAADVQVPLHQNPRLPSLIKADMPEGLRLRDELGSGYTVRMEAGCLHVKLPARTAVALRPAARL